MMDLICAMLASGKCTVPDIEHCLLEDSRLSKIVDRIYDDYSDGTYQDIQESKSIVLSDQVDLIEARQAEEDRLTEMKRKQSDTSIVTNFEY